MGPDPPPGGKPRTNPGGGPPKPKPKERGGGARRVGQTEHPPYQYVVVEGTVVDTTPTPVEVREAIAIRYLGEEGGRAFVRSMEGQNTVLFTIRPDRWITADFSDEL